MVSEVEYETGITRCEVHPILSTPPKRPRRLVKADLHYPAFRLRWRSGFFRTDGLQAAQQIVFHYYVPVHIFRKLVAGLNHTLNFGLVFG